MKGFLEAAALLILAGAAVFAYRQIRTQRSTSWFHSFWEARLGIMAGVAVLLALSVYAFFTSAGRWTSWPDTGRHYDNLAVAFRAGRLDLNIQAPAALLALPDPYDPARKSLPEIRAFVDTVWDLSLYHGKFYPYWGPAPAVFLALLKLISRAHIADSYVAFGFLAGLLAITTLFIVRLQRRFGRHVPASLTLMCILVAAFAIPIPWMLNRARVYEAAISAGQFFLISGLFVAYVALERERTSTWGLVLAAACWSLALGSRLTTILAVAVLAGTTLLFAVKKSASGSRTRDATRYALALALPLVAGLAALGWYNWERFGSAFETGLRYQLTDTNMRLFYWQTFSARYMAPNLLLYLLDPISIHSRFPFLAPAVMHLPDFLHASELRIYHVQNSVGILWAVPFTLFALIPVSKEGLSVWRAFRRKEAAACTKEDALLSWIAWSLIGAIVVSLAMLLSFFYVAVRYLVEFMPSLILLSTLGVWQGYRVVQQRRGPRRLYVLLVVLFALVTILVGILLAFAEDSGTLVRFNPQLMRQLISLFGK